jgi:hypothetical protein
MQMTDGYVTVGVTPLARPRARSTTESYVTPTVT